MALPKRQDQDEDAVKRGGPNLINYNAATGASMALFVGPNNPVHYNVTKPTTHRRRECR